MVKRFVTALQFLTIFRVRKYEDVSEGDLAESMVFFPLVGFLIGVILVYADLGLQWIVPETLGNALILVVLAVITRALHIDGLADTSDGLMGGRDRESRLVIMRDSRIGTAGVLSIIFLVLIKYLSLNTLFHEQKTIALLMMPLFGRWSQLLMMYRAEYGRPDGMGRAFVGHVRGTGLLAATALTLVLSSFVLVHDLATWLLAVVIICAVLLFTVLCRWYVVGKLGGVTGDAVGAVSELNETMTLLLFVLFLSGR